MHYYGMFTQVRHKITYSAKPGGIRSVVFPRGEPVTKGVIAFVAPLRVFGCSHPDPLVAGVVAARRKRAVVTFPR